MYKCHGSAPLSCLHLSPLSNTRWSQKAWMTSERELPCSQSPKALRSGLVASAIGYKRERHDARPTEVERARWKKKEPEVHIERVIRVLVASWSPPMANLHQVLPRKAFRPYRRVSWGCHPHSLLPGYRSSQKRTRDALGSPECFRNPQDGARRAVSQMSHQA